MREHRARGVEALSLATSLLQRIRLENPDLGLWEAADVQWWSRRPRASDDVDRPFWLDDVGPVAGVLMTSWRDDRWQCDPLLLPSADLDPDLLWSRAADLISVNAVGTVEVMLDDSDPTFTGLVTDAGFAASGTSSTAWMSPADRPRPQPPGAGFAIVDRVARARAPHPMIQRNGPLVAERLRACSLYDPELDLSVVSDDGQIAGYSLYWFDPVTLVGLVEPVRVEDRFQRRGLATAMLLEGIDRLARRGAARIKIGFESDAASAVYQGVGFRPTQTATTYQATGPPTQER